MTGPVLVLLEGSEGGRTVMASGSSGKTVGVKGGDEGGVWYDSGSESAEASGRLSSSSRKSAKKVSQKVGGVAVPGSAPSSSARHGVGVREGGTGVDGSASLRLSKKVEEGERVKSEAREGEETVVEGVETLNSGDGARSCWVGGSVVLSAIGARARTERLRKGGGRRRGFGDG
jgi:hypothetical protein